MSRPPRVMVDTLPIESTSGGQRVYLLNLLAGLIARGDCRLHLVCSKSNVVVFRGLAGVQVTEIPWPTTAPLLRVLTQQLVLPAIALVKRPDVLFVPRDVAPLLAPVPVVTAILSGHLNYRFRIERLGMLRSLYQRVFIRLTLRKSARILAISEYVAQRTAEDFGLPRHKIVVTYLGGGVGEALMKRSGPGSAAREGGEIVLFVSTLFRHKNAERVLEAYARLPGAPRLVLAGKDAGGERARLEARSRELGVTDRVTFAGRVTDDELVRLYQRAVMLVYPSAVEGFGLPLAEAMWLGVPIVASDRTSVPEVVGDAGLIVDPDDVSALAHAMEQVLGSPAVRARLRDAGHRRRTLFSWDRTAEQTAQVLSAFAGSRDR